MGFINALATFGAKYLLPAAVDIGAKYVGNKLISQPNSAMTFEQQNILNSMAYQRSKEAATKAWQRTVGYNTTAYNRSKEAATTQYDRELTAFGKRYQLTMEDMAKAGLNPILAASGGFNVGSGVSAGMAQVMPASAHMAQSNAGSGTPVAYPEVGSSALSFKQAQKAGEEIKEIDSRIYLNMTRAVESIQSAYLKRAQAGVATSQEKVNVQQIKNMKQQITAVAERIRETSANIVVLEQQKYLMESEIEQLDSLRKKNNADVARLKMNIKEMQSNLIKIQKQSKVYGSKAGTIMVWTQEILKTLGNILSGTLVGVGASKLMNSTGPYQSFIGGR